VFWQTFPDNKMLFPYALGIRISGMLRHRIKQHKKKKKKKKTQLNKIKFYKISLKSTKLSQDVNIKSQKH